MFRPCLIALFLISNANGFDLFGSKVKQISKSGRSLTLDRGEVEGVRKGDKVKFLLRIGSEDNPKLTYFSNAEAIKVHSNYSYWILQNINQDISVKQDDELVFIKISEIIENRSKQGVLQKRIILPKGKTIIEFKKDQTRGVPDKLEIVKDDRKEVKEELLKPESVEDVDFKITHVDKWNEKGSSEYSQEHGESIPVKYKNSIRKQIDPSEIIKEDNQAIFDSVVKGIAKKMEDAKDPLNDIHGHNLKDKDGNLKRGYILNSKAQKERSDYEASEFVKRKKFSMIDREGDLWSKKYNDKELRDVLIKTGMAKEIERHYRVVDKKADHEFFLRYKKFLSNNSNPNDTGLSGNGYGISVGYELHVMRLLKDMESWSVEFEAQKSVTYNDLGNFNGRFLETRLGGKINYYIFSTPADIKQLLWFVGAGLNFGSADVTASSLETSSYTYSINTFPSFHIGAKYRFTYGDVSGQKYGLGISFLISSGTVNYSNVDDTSENIFGTISRDDTKFVTGINFYL